MAPVPNGPHPNAPIGGGHYHPCESGDAQHKAGPPPIGRCPRRYLAQRISEYERTKQAAHVDLGESEVTHHQRAHHRNIHTAKVACHRCHKKQDDQCRRLGSGFGDHWISMYLALVQHKLSRIGQILLCSLRLPERLAGCDFRQGADPLRREVDGERCGFSEGSSTIDVLRHSGEIADKRVLRRSGSGRVGRQLPVCLKKVGTKLSRAV